jgi:hypothetical protein
MAEPGREAYEAAERLVAEAHRRAEEAARAAANGIPAGGWASGQRETDSFPDLNALVALFEAAKGSLPPELLRAVADALRELLIAIRAVLDYSIERLDYATPTEPDVEDIPIQ